MAVRTQVVEAISNSSGRKQITVDRMLRGTVQREYTPKGSPGRGPATHFDARAMRYVLLALAASQPHEACEAIERLDDLVMDADKAVTLGDWLQRQIEYLATPEGAAATRSEIAQRDAIEGSKSQLTLCLNPALSWYSFLSDDGTEFRRITFRPAKPDKSPPKSLRQLTTLSVDLLLVAGNLVADTLQHEQPVSLENISTKKNRAASDGNPSGPVTDPAPKQKSAKRRAVSTQSSRYEQSLLAIDGGRGAGFRQPVTEK